MKRLTLLFIGTEIMLAASCHDGGGQVGAGAGGPAGNVLLNLAGAPANVVQLVATLQRPGYTTISISLTAADSGWHAAGTFSGVPVGTWHLIVVARDKGGVVQYTGETDVDALPGQTSEAALRLTPATGSLAINVAWGENCLHPPSGLLGWWPGDGTTADVVGGCDGIPVPSASYGPGKVGTAFSFDGLTQYLRIPNTPAFNPPGSFTIDAWVYPMRDVPEAAILSKWGGGYGAWAYQASWWFGVGAGGTLDFSMSDSIHQHDEAYHVFRSAAGLVKMNVWTHVAAVYDRDTYTRSLYVNGVKVGQRRYEPFNNFVSPADVGIGGWILAPSTVSFLFPGMIDEVDFYGRALGGSEVRDIYMSGSTGKCR